MRKIDKACKLSTAYQTWEDGLKDKTHPKYNSSEGEYYLDIIMQLFYCQKGLCAYTEQRLCPEEYYQSHHWTAGVYASSKPPDNLGGQLDHFDASLKSKKKDKEGKKDWLWSNFFLVQTDINIKVKRTKPVDYILKPDEESYDPFRLLEYDFETHMFIPNSSLDKSEAARVEKMLLTLGVNYFNDTRRSYLEDKIKLIFLSKEKWEGIDVRAYPTAFEMCKVKVESGEITFDHLFPEIEVVKDDILLRDELPNPLAE